MSFFQRPGDSSSEEDSSSDEEEELDVSLNEQTHDSAKDSIGTTEDVIGHGLTPTETISLTNSVGEDGTITTVDDHRNLMLATLLEEISKYKATEMLNAANAGNGKTFTKDSPEVQEFARSLFANSSGMLNNAGLLPADTTSEEKKTSRQQYMAGLDRWNYQQALDATHKPSTGTRRPGLVNGERALVRRQSQQPTSFLTTTAGQLQQFDWETSQVEIARRPSAELQLSSLMPVQVRSHYSAHFEERGLLGRGGFGRVYHTYSYLDRREYAVKKIPLSPKLSQRYRQGGHAELANVLREVQALASLDHCNVVRYHGTWIEEPSAPPSIPVRPANVRANQSFRGQLLLKNKPASSTSPPSKTRPLAPTFEEDHSIDPFDRAGSNNDKQLWSYQNPQTPSVSGIGDTNPFSDGRSPQNQSNLVAHMDDPSVYILHVQMSMYPMTLSEYLLPLSSPRKSTSNLRHCFHLVPTLRILLAILSGLQYIHAAGFIHRDIKPSNIFLGHVDFASPLAFSDGYADTGSCASCPSPSPRYLNPRIGDFGLVADLERAATGKQGRGHSQSHSSSESPSKPVGTEYYRPPPPPPLTKGNLEAAANNPVDEKTDVFALGVILLELLYSTGTRMERTDLLSGAQKGRIPPSLSQSLAAQKYTPEIVQNTIRLVSGMIDPDPKIRWRCGMVKTGAEGLLAKIEEFAKSMMETPD